LIAQVVINIVIVSEWYLGRRGGIVGCHFEGTKNKEEENGMELLERQGGAAWMERFL